MIKKNSQTKISLFILALLNVSPVFAQNENQQQGLDEQSGQVLETIEVTGTRLKVAAPSEPLTVISAEDIELRGINNIDQLLRQLTFNNTSISSANAGGINGSQTRNRGTTFSNFSGGSSVNLRGLGSGSSLVLINGRRVAGEGSANNDFVDISAISIESIERVEILTAGASAIYGADAVAGVVNIILKKDYNESNISLRHEISSSGGDETRISGTFGRNWDTGNITVSASYQDTDAVSAREFGVTTRDFRPLGGLDRRGFSSTRGIFQVSEAQLQGLDPSDDFAQSIFLLPPNSPGIDDFTDVSELTRLDRSALLNSPDVNELLPIGLSPEETEYSISARIRQDLRGEKLSEAFLDVFYSKRETQTLVEAPMFLLDGFDIGDGFFGFPFFDDNSFSGFREDVAFSADLSPIVAAGIIPNDSFETESENYSFTAGLRGDFTENWDWEVNASYSLNEDTDFSTQLELFDVYFGSFNEETGEDLTEPFNLVRGDFATNPEAAAALRNTVFTDVLAGETELWSVQAIGRGQLLSNREAGALEISYGGEYREESVGFTEFSSSIFRIATTIPNLDATRTTTAIFGEASLPLTSKFTANAALRYESIDNEGTTVTAQTSLNEFFTTGEDQFDPVDILSPFDQTDEDLIWRLGLAWEPTANLLFRATTGISFRAPNAFEVGEPSVTTSLDDDGLVDPININPVDENTPFIAGGNADLESETAQTLNIGFVYNTRLLGQDLFFEADYFEINYEDRITSSGPFAGSSIFGDPLFEEAVQRGENGEIDFIFIRPINLAREDLSGIDLKVSHFTDIGAVVVENQLNYSRTLDRETQVNEGGIVEDRLGISAPESRWNFSSILSYGDISLTGVVQHTGDYESRRGDRVSSFTTLDLNLVYNHSSSSELTNGLVFSLGAANVFNEDPPFLDANNGFSSLFYDIRRRVVQFEVRKNF